MKDVVDSQERVERRKVRQRVRVRSSSRRAEARRRRGRRLRILAAILAVLLALVALSLIPALAVRDRLQEARSELQGAVSALLTGDAATAGRGFVSARDAFLRAEDQAENPMLRFAGLLPVLGRTADAVTNMARAGGLIARGGEVVAGGLAELPSGTAALAPEDGVIPLEPLRRLAPALEEAQGLLAEATTVMEASPARGLLASVAQAQAELSIQLDRAERGLTAAAALSRALPTYLGDRGPRRYFLAAQNPAELRGTGGFIGAYAIVTARDGQLELGDFRPIDSLPDVPPGRVEPPNPDYAARYDRFGGAGFWRNINMTADFPSAAVAMERLYEEVRGVELDGAMAADPMALAALMEAAGGVTVPGTDRLLEAETAVAFLTNEAYAVFPDSQTRKSILGDVAEAVLDRFLQGGFPGGPGGAARALVEAGADGHLLLHSTHPREQASFVRAGVAGALGGAGADYLAVVANNAAGNKLDFYARRSLRYEVRLGAEGSATGDLTVTLENPAPRSGPPAYVIGPYSDEFRAGENVSFLDVYCARACGLEGVTIDGKAATVGAGTELGHAVFTHHLRMESGATRTLEFRRSLPAAWAGDDSAGTYRLRFRGQPTIRPTPLVVDIRVPEGMEILRASPGMQVSGGRAVWRGTAGDLMTFEVEFQRPFPARMWRNVVRFLSQPVP